MCCLFAAAQDEDFSKVQIKVTKVAGSVYMLEGSGGNIGASVGDDGIVIVDDQYAPLAEKIQAALKGITDKPVRFVINTHYHGDHTGGNEYFQKQAPIIAHDNVRKRLEAGGPAGNGGTMHMEHKPAVKGALPIITFDHDVTVHLNGEDIRALYFPAGHTDGDSVIFFSKSNVVHMGDLMFNRFHPFIDRPAGASIANWITALENVPREHNADTIYIFGHSKDGVGPTGSRADLANFRDYLTAVLDYTGKQMAAGKSKEQIARLDTLRGFEDYAAPAPEINLASVLTTAYDELSEK